MTKFRVLVVDDEPLARAAVAGIVNADAEVDAIGECSDGLAARAAIERDRPDIVFLDIEMPGLDGLCLADGLPPGGPVVVFTTAYSQYAPQAFDVAATDYVLKPFSRERLLASLARAKRRVRERRLGQLASEIAEGSANTYLKRLALKVGERTLVVSEDDVIWVEAQDYCVMVHSTRGRHLLRASLASFEARLDPARFVRAHRAAVVNVAHVRELIDRDGLVLVLSDGSEVGVSRARRQHVDALLSSRRFGSARPRNEPGALR
ncbi:MAG TPA: LytTR family DNA-binding domain-containing protein [Vicinamibacterales bacterium]|jgi:two-component system LytT family response regulator|nr:LytTR family DNA-binding domain-containing protein [Vicinamibacterales bacterium]